jgi:hypothetical protein
MKQNKAWRIRLEFPDKKFTISLIFFFFSGSCFFRCLTVDRMETINSYRKQEKKRKKSASHWLLFWIRSRFEMSLSERSLLVRLVLCIKSIFKEKKQNKFLVAGLTPKRKCKFWDKRQDTVMRDLWRHKEKTVQSLTKAKLILEKICHCMQSVASPAEQKEGLKKEKFLI